MYTEIETFHPHCYPITLQTDISELYQSLIELLGRLNLTYKQIEDFASVRFGTCLNLTHLPGLTGENRYRKHSRGHRYLLLEGVDEKDFTEHLAESQDLLIGKIIKEVYNFHNGPFQGRCQLIWMAQKKIYNFHTDPHTQNRYHIPIVTNKDCYWLFREKEGSTEYKLHMPADGRIWYLNPNSVEHAFINDSNAIRLHLILTSGY